MTTKSSRKTSPTPQLLLGCLLTLLSPAHAAPPQPPTAIDTSDIRHFMAEHYGQHDAASKHWIRKRDRDKDGTLLWSHEICASLNVTIKGSPQLLLAVCNNNADYCGSAGAQDCKDTTDFYQLQKMDGKVRVTANSIKTKNPYIESVGNASVVRLGKDFYGFRMFGAGMVYEGGCGYGVVELVVPQADRFVKALEFTDDYDGGGPRKNQPELRYQASITIDASQPNPDYYPLQVSETQSRSVVDNKDVEKIIRQGIYWRQQYVLVFNPTTGHYDFPKNLRRTDDISC